MKRLPILLIVLCLGCQQPKPAPEPAPEPTEPAKPAINDLAQIDEMAIAADGKEFIAHPPTCYYDHTTALICNAAIKQQYRDKLATWAESAKESGKQSALIDIQKARNRREKIAKLIESEPVHTDSDSVADAWSKLSR